MPREFLRPHGIDRRAVVGDDGHPRVGLDQKRHARDGLHVLHQTGKVLRAEGAVDAHRRRTQLLKGLDRVDAVAAEVSRTVCLHGQTAHDGKIAHTLRRVQRDGRFVDAKQRFRNDQIRARLRLRGDLLGVEVKQLRRTHRTVGLQGDARGGQVARDQRASARGLAAERHERTVHLRDVFVQPVVLQGVAVGREGRRVQNLRARRDVLPLEVKKHLRVLQHPLFRAAAARHPAGHQVRAGRAVEQDRLFHGGEFLFCHVFPLALLFALLYPLFCRFATVEFP